MIALGPMRMWSLHVPLAEPSANIAQIKRRLIVTNTTSFNSTGKAMRTHLVSLFGHFNHNCTLNF